VIRRIAALNYKSLRYVDQPVGPFQVLVGPNATGKSAFLDVVRLIGDILRFGLEEAILGDPHGWPPGRARRAEELIFNQVSTHFELAVELVVPEELREPWAKGDEAFVRYELDIGTQGRNGELALLGETLWRCAGRPPQTRPPAPQPTLFPAEPTPPETILVGQHKKKAPTGWRKIVNKSPQGNDVFVSETTRWNNVFRVGSHRSALANLPEDESKFPVALWVRDALREGIKPLALDIDEMRRAVSPSQTRTFLPNGSNLPLVIRDLKETRRVNFDAWVGHVREVLTDMASIDVVERPEDNHAYLVIQYRSGGAKVPSWLLSDGTLRFLALTVLPYLGVGPAVYLVEEPENGIHPRALDAVFDSLSSVYEGHVSVATHSPLVLSLAAKHREQILCFAKNPSGATAIVSGDRHPALRDWTGRPDLSVLYAAGVLG
jgi:predicted ATPase